MISVKDVDLIFETSDGPVHEALKKWKELNSPRKVERDPMNIPSGI